MKKEYDGAVTAWINEEEKSITISPNEVGTGFVKIYAETYSASNSAQMVNYDIITINVNVQEDAEKLQKEIDELTKFCTQNDIKTIKKANASDQLLYIRSILYNDSQNGNNDLWNKFVKETTAEERKNMSHNINMLRDESEENNTAKKVLMAQVQLDNDNITKKEFSETLGIGQNAQSSYVSKLITLKATVTGERSSSGDFDDILDKIKNYKKPSDLDLATSTKIENAASKVLTAITNVGIVASIIIIAVLGIKYMLGSLEEKAEFKKDMIPYLIGACLLFGVTAFVKIFMQWGKIISDL